MSEAGPNHSIAGDWLGRYFYSDDMHGSAFEIIFLESKGYIEGSVLDDGQLGEAFVTGSFNYPNLKFVKKYRKPGLEPITYIGSMSEDGQSLRGTWWIVSKKEQGGTVSGTWLANRSGGQTEELPEKLVEELTLSSTI